MIGSAKLVMTVGAYVGRVSPSAPLRTFLRWVRMVLMLFWVISPLGGDTADLRR